MDYYRNQMILIPQEHGSLNFEIAVVTNFNASKLLRYETQGLLGLGFNSGIKYMQMLQVLHFITF